MVFVYHFEANPEFGAAAGRLLEAAESGRIRLVTSILTLTEVLVVPKRRGATDLVRRYRDVFRAFPNLTVLDIGSEIADIASDLRADLGLRMPDAIQVATAMAHRADAFVTEDRRLPASLPIPLLRLDQTLP